MSGRIKTEYGDIFDPSGSCRDAYPNMELYDQPPEGGSPIKLQAPAMRSLKDCERRYAKLTRPHRRRRYIRVTGSWRSCQYQRELWESDPERFAHPDSGVHPDGLAIDVVNPVPRIVRRILLAHGWTQARPDDEPWHFSFGVTA